MRERIQRAESTMIGTNNIIEDIEGSEDDLGKAKKANFMSLTTYPTNKGRINTQPKVG